VKCAPVSHLVRLMPEGHGRRHMAEPNCISTIRSLICHRDIDMAISCLGSLTRFSRDPVQLLPDHGDPVSVATRPSTACHPLALAVSQARHVGGVVKYRMLHRILCGSANRHRHPITPIGLTRESSARHEPGGGVP
jgi:hypothetical protein